MSSFDQLNVKITISPIEILALKNLSLVSHALADKIGGAASPSQRALASVLDDVIRRMESAAATRDGAD